MERRRTRCSDEDTSVTEDSGNNPTDLSGITGESGGFLHRDMKKRCSLRGHGFCSCTRLCVCVVFFFLGGGGDAECDADIHRTFAYFTVTDEREWRSGGCSRFTGKTRIKMMFTEKFGVLKKK